MFEENLQSMFQLLKSIMGVTKRRSRKGDQFKKNGSELDGGSVQENVKYINLCILTFIGKWNSQNGGDRQPRQQQEDN